MKDFAGRTAFVTGGANGVGIGIVRNLLNEGVQGGDCRHPRRMRSTRRWRRSTTAR